MFQAGTVPGREHSREVKDVMSVIKRKLNSDRGASITWALLIFLVCAVIGSAVLVAGTASSGRMSEVADNDQRYYAVTSAARLLIDLIDDETATIVKEETKAGDSPAETKYYIDGKQIPEGITKFESVTEQAAYHLMKGEEVSNDFDLTASKSELDVTIQETVDADTGEMTLEIKKTTGNGEKSKTYSLILFFNLDKSEIQETKEGTAQTITTTTGSFTWRLRDIQVGGSQRWVETS